MKSGLGRTAIAILIVLTIFSHLGCSSAKYSAGFKSEKKQIDALTIFSPLVNVTFKKDQLTYIDTAFSTSIQQQMEEITLEVLSSKFNVEQVSLSSVNQKALFDLFHKLDNSPKTLDAISSGSLFEINPGCNSRYAVLLTFHSEINANFGPHQNVSTGMATNSIIIAPHTKPHSELRLMVLDMNNDEIVFCDMIKSSNFDPRIESEIKHKTKTILKKVYYF